MFYNLLKLLQYCWNLSDLSDMSWTGLTKKKITKHNVIQNNFQMANNTQGSGHMGHAWTDKQTWLKTLPSRTSGGNKQKTISE